MPITESPLRYPGGKTQLTPLVVQLLEKNSIQRGVYAEPFAGGAGIAWRLLLRGHVSEVWINDIDPAIYAFWHCVINDPAQLCDRIQDTKLSMEEWENQRSILMSAESTIQDLAFSTLFMNRTNRSGILKGGVIGGKNQTGNYKLDCRFNRDDLIKKIRKIHSYRSSIKLSHLDAEICLKNWESELPSNSLVNIDPPYYLQGRDLYLSFYDREDHARLAKLIRTLSLKWMLTYDDVPEIEDLYSGMPIYRKGLIYYAQLKRRASELMIFSEGLGIPNSLEPAALATV